MEHPQKEAWSNIPRVSVILSRKLSRLMKSYFVARFDLEELTGEASGQKSFYNLILVTLGWRSISVCKCKIVQPGNQIN